MLCHRIFQRYDKQSFEKKEVIRYNGKIYSEEHRRKFDIKNDIFKAEKSSFDDNKFVLTIKNGLRSNGKDYNKHYITLYRQRRKTEDLRCDYSQKEIVFPKINSFFEYFCIQKQYQKNYEENIPNIIPHTDSLPYAVSPR